MCWDQFDQFRRDGRITSAEICIMVNQPQSGQWDVWERRQRNAKKKKKEKEREK